MSGRWTRFYVASLRRPGLAAALAIEEETTIQAVDYTALRARLLLSDTLSGEVNPIIPQTN